ncbi:hypothetical protein JTB14_019748 [Gonioctena quinquepunctata]|nr:hypothetical protein JTB14_019748 [Gonioctena quinquepunctata]
MSNTCAGLTQTETRGINAKKGLTWTCNQCQNFGNNLKAFIIALQAEVKELKKTRKNEFNGSNPHHYFEEVIQELQERNTRKCNLIVFGANKQSHDLSKEEGSVADQNEVSKILKAVLPTFDSRNVRAI